MYHHPWTIFRKGQDLNENFIWDVDGTEWKPRKAHNRKERDFIASTSMSDKEIISSSEDWTLKESKV